MNLKRTLFTGLAAAGLMASIATPMVMAQDTDLNIATVPVSNNGGTFDAKICGPVLLGAGGNVFAPDPVDVNSFTGGTATGGMGICYTDTKAFREGFTVNMDAGVFESNVPQHNNPQFTYQIPAENFSITFVANPAQGQWGWTNPDSPVPHVPGTPGQPGHYDIGDIGGNTATNGTVTSSPGKAWGNGADLSTNPQIGYGWDGVGTANGVLVGPFGGIVDGTFAGFETALEVPHGAYAATYTSNLTLTVTFGQP